LVLDEKTPRKLRAGMENYNSGLCMVSNYIHCNFIEVQEEINLGY
jgi:hypothetical protein